VFFLYSLGSTLIGISTFSMQPDAIEAIQKLTEWGGCAFGPCILGPTFPGFPDGGGTNDRHRNREEKFFSKAWMSRRIITTRLSHENQGSLSKLDFLPCLVCGSSTNLLQLRNYEDDQRGGVCRHATSRTAVERVTHVRDTSGSILQQRLNV
jgi:hypothetical protein